MKVEESSINQAAVSHAGRAAESAAAAAGSSKRGSEAHSRNDHDKVQLSDLSGRLVQMFGADTPERSARIEQLTADYRSGRYQPDSLATSRGIVAEALANEA